MISTIVPVLHQYQRDSLQLFDVQVAIYVVYILSEKKFGWLYFHEEISVVKEVSSQSNNKKDSNICMKLWATTTSQKGKLISHKRL